MNLIKSLAKLGVGFWVTILIGLMLLRRDRTDKTQK